MEKLISFRKPYHKSNNNNNKKKNNNLREFALCYSRHPGDMRVRSRVRLAVADTTSGDPSPSASD